MRKLRKAPLIRLDDTYRLDAITHWQRVLMTPGLPQLSYDMAKAGLEKLGGKPAREPGSDDE